MKTIYHTLSVTTLLFAGFLLHGQKSVYTLPFENEYRLPAMQTRINSEEIANTYQTMGNIYTTEITGLGEEKMEQTSMTFISDTKVVDAIRFLEFYLEDQLITPGEETHGAVEMSIIYYHERGRFNPGAILSILTIGLGTLCGIPFSTTVVDVEIESNLYDESEHIFATYRGVGRGKKAQTIYNITTRKAHQKALRNALVDLNTKIMEDQNNQILSVLP